MVIDDKPISVAIIDDNVEFCRIMTKLLDDSGMYRVVGMAHDGVEGLRFLKDSEAPIDVALIDVVLPKKDGLYILEEISKRPEKKPVCIMFSGVSRDSVTKKAFELGAAYFILKPFDIDLLLKRIKIVWHDSILGMDDSNAIHTEKPASPEDFVNNILRKIPIPSNLKGFAYLRTAILMVIENMELLEGVTKILYPDIAKKYSSTSPCVERSMRHAIETAWKKGCGDNYYRITGMGEVDDAKPTIRAFISTIAEMYDSERRKSNG